MSRFLPLLTKMAAAVLLIGSMNMNVWAEKAISDSLPGVEYDSVADLENCIKNHKGKRKHPDTPYIFSMERLFIPQSVAEGKYEISSIELTPTAIHVYFDNGNIRLTQILSSSMARDEYKMQFESDNEIYATNPESKEVNGRMVYSTHDCLGEVYCWKQGEDVFILENFAEKGSENRNSYHLCQASSIALPGKSKTEKGAQPKPRKVQVVDKEGNPVTNLCVKTTDYTDSVAPKDRSKERSYAYTDENGIAELCVFEQDISDVFDVHAIAWEGGEHYSFRKSKQADGVYRVVWEEEKPLKTVEKEKESVIMRFTDKEQNPVVGLQVAAYREADDLSHKNSDWKMPEVLQGYTDGKGYFYSAEKIDGTPLKFVVTKTEESGKKTTKTYHITPENNKQNRYRMKW